MDISFSKIKEKIGSVEKKYAWGIIGTGVSLTFGIIGLFSFLDNPKKNISFQVIDELPVFNVNKKIDGLTILFNSSDILSTKRNLVITRVRVKNTGDIEILPTQYDQQDPWGLEIQNGQIIEGRIFDASSEYVRNKARPKLVNKKVYEIEKIIFEKEQYLTFELISLVEDGGSPKFNVLGKIAGIKEIDFYEKKESPGEIKDNLFEFWSKVHYGSPVVHITRFLLYLLYISIFMILCITLVSAESKK